MGCSGSSARGDAVPDDSAATAARQNQYAFVEQLFAQCGTLKSLNPGEVLITQGVESEAAYFIKEGKVELKLSGEKGEQTLATRGPGDVIGELSLLLGNAATVTVVATGPVTVIEVLNSRLMSQLRETPAQSGRLFKAIATVLAERISELSGKMRSNVVAASTPGGASKSQLPAADISKARALFGLQADEKLIGMYQCTVRREINAMREDTANVGELYIFDSHLCFDLKMFAFHKQWVLPAKDIVSLLKTGEQDVVDIHFKGSSYEVHITEGFDEACLLMEACRLKLKAITLQSESSRVGDPAEGGGVDATDLDGFHHMIEPIVASQEAPQQKKHNALDFDLKEEDWKHFMNGAKQLSFRKGQTVLQEGQSTAALYQIIKGKLRVELQIKDKPQAVVVGFRTAGEMFGETSLLKSGVATASIVADSDATLICLEGTFLEELFQEKPELPGRFFCFIAAYQADRLYRLTQTAADAKKPQVTTNAALRISINDVFSNQAYTGIFNKFLTKELEESQKSKGGAKRSSLGGNEKIAMNSFNFYTAANEYKFLPDAASLLRGAKDIVNEFMTSSGASYLAYVDKSVSSTTQDAITEIFAASPVSTTTARKVFADMEAKALAHLETTCFEAFLVSDHYNYIIELKAKEGTVPKLDDFQVIRVLGEGGFGQVIEVVKRDCGVRYAMKVMMKESMKQNLGSSWRKKIALEQHLLAILSHPFMVNLKYAFQNIEFLCLVMDLVPSGDLSEFVLTSKRLTAEQSRWATMETVEVLSYMHNQKILYRDLKPENLLVDEEGHVRLIDMGLAIRWTGDKPRRSSRVGTDCYMAPEVRWARKQNQAYGTSCDWYTVGVLLYEFSNGALPFTKRDTYNPVYREGTWPSAECKSLCEGLLVQNWRNRIGCGPTGADEIKAHPYFAGVDWDIVTACKIPSPLKGVKGVPKRKKDKEVQAQRTAGHIAEADNKEADPVRQQVDNVDTWDFVATTAITEEYMESMYQAVSSI